MPPIAGALRPASSPRSHVLRALFSRGRVHAAGRHPPRPVLSAGRARRTNRRTLTPGRPADLARRPEATRDRARRGARRRAGSAGRPCRRQPVPPGLLRREARRDPGRARGDRARPGRRSSSAPRSRPGRRPTDRTRGVETAHVRSSSDGATHVILVDAAAAGCVRRRRRRHARSRSRCARRSGDLDRLRPATDETRGPRGRRRHRERHVSPDKPTSRRRDALGGRDVPGRRALPRRGDGRAVGAATVGRIYMYPPEFDGAAGASVDVLPEARRQGIGTALLTGDLERRAVRRARPALHIAALRGPARGHRLPRAARLRGVRARQDRPARACGPDAAGDRSSADGVSLTLARRTA